MSTGPPPAADEKKHLGAAFEGEPCVLTIGGALLFVLEEKQTDRFIR